MTGNSAELLERLESFSIDLAVTAERPSSEAFVARRLRQDRLVAVVPKGWPLAGTSSLTLARIADGPLILREEGSVTRRLLLDEMRRRGLKQEATIEIESREAAREAVAQGLGVAVMSEGELVPDPRLKTFAIADWQASMEEWLLCLKSRADLHLIRSFLAELPENS